MADSKSTSQTPTNDTNAEIEISLRRIVTLTEPSADNEQAFINIRYEAERIQRLFSTKGGVTSGRFHQGS